MVCARGPLGAQKSQLTRHNQGDEAESGFVVRSLGHCILRKPIDGKNSSSPYDMLCDATLIEGTNLT
jgi:hypothetical protein